MNPFAYIAERKIQEAIDRGDLDEYEGKGKPMQLQGDPMVPAELRMAYKMLKNSGYLPPEAQDLKEVHNILELLEDCSDEQVRFRQMNKLNVLMTRINKDRRYPIQLEELTPYYTKTVERMTVERNK